MHTRNLEVVGGTPGRSHAEPLGVLPDDLREVSGLQGELRLAVVVVPDLLVHSLQVIAHWGALGREEEKGNSAATRLRQGPTCTKTLPPDPVVPPVKEVLPVVVIVRIVLEGVGVGQVLAPLLGRYGDLQTQNEILSHCTGVTAPPATGMPAGLASLCELLSPASLFALRTWQTLTFKSSLSGWALCRLRYLLCSCSSFSA